MLEEFLGGRTGVGPRQFRGGELGIERNGFVKVLHRILRLKLLGKVAARRNSFLASSDLVVMGILPPPADAADVPSVFVLSQALHVAALSTSTANTQQLKLFRRIGLLLRIS